MSNVSAEKMARIETLPARQSAAGWLANDAVLAAGLFVLTLLSRIPFVTHILYHWDSVNFAFAIREFNIAKEQPHPPGYAGYVWLTQLLDAFLRDAQTTLVSISVVASALSVVALFYLGRAMFGRQVGLIAALLLASSPLFWFYGEIALPHTLDTFLVIATVWLFYLTMRRDARLVYPAVVVAAVAGGVRPQTLVFLAPLMLFAMRRVGWKNFVLAGLLGAVICVAWFLPLTAAAGGISGYFAVMSAFSHRFQDSTSVFAGAGWFGLRRNLIKLSLYSAYAWSVAAVPALLYMAWRLVRRRRPQNWEAAIFLALWLGPTLFFYALIHMGQQGLVFVFLPALLLLSAVGLARLLAGRPSILVAAVVVLVAVNAAIFLLLPERPLPGKTVRLLTWQTLQNSDAYYTSRLNAIRQNYPPASTAIIASNWHHLEYYLPEYTLLPFSVGSKWELVQGAPVNSQATRLTPADLGLQVPAVVVLFDDGLAEFNAAPAQAHALPLPGGNSLTVIPWPAQETFELGTESFGFLPR